MGPILPCAVRRAATCVAVVVAVGACGGESPKPPEAKGPPAAPPPGAPGAPGAAPPGMENYIVLGDNPRWRSIKAQYEAYALRSIEGVNNFALNNMTAFIDKPIVQEASVDGGGPGPDPPKDPIELDDTCATKAPLERYSLILVMSGIPQPKALLVGVGNDPCEVMRGDGLGNEGGRVLAITQYKLIVSQPGKEKPVELTLAPPLSVGDSAEGEEGAVP